jgi:hypothetical protein
MGRPRKIIVNEDEFLITECELTDGYYVDYQNKRAGWAPTLESARELMEKIVTIKLMTPEQLKKHNDYINRKLK